MANNNTEAVSPEQKQADFLNRWASGEGIEFVDEDARKGYQYRAGLIKDAIQLKKTPDRVPVFPLGTFLPTMLYGHTGKEAMYDPHTLGKANLAFAKEYDVDAAGASPMVMYGPALETLGYQLYKWPGHGVKDEFPYQFVEKEYMKADEYDHLINDPSDYWFRIWFSRICGELAPLAELPPIYGTMELPMSVGYLATLGAPPIQAAFQKLLEAGRHCFEWIGTLGAYIGQTMASGYPLYAGGATKAPFDVLADSFRGTTPVMMDLYRQPEKVLEAVDRLVPLMIGTGAGGALANNNPIVFIPLHKGADGFMSNEQFEKFYWPSLRAVMLGLIDYGCVPCCFVEGGYNDRLEFLTDLPQGTSFFIFDKTDMARAREVLGGKSCIGGGFPVSLIITGTVDQVEDETRKLLDAAAGDGGYILSIGCAMDEAKEDTLKAFIETGKKYGKY
jgi:hypothetical protein